uniref:Uncharacterized protein n=1 Tax=Eutreptiella gymnastica TaxID=73025 RepID=A0A7S1IZD5_9EUGL
MYAMPRRAAALYMRRCRASSQTMALRCLMQCPSMPYAVQVLLFLGASPGMSRLTALGQIISTPCCLASARGGATPFKEQYLVHLPYNGYGVRLLLRPPHPRPTSLPSSVWPSRQASTRMPPSGKRNLN